ncbi:hypothetical protein GCM10027068_23310 [Prescottella soli]
MSDNPSRRKAQKQVNTLRSIGGVRVDFEIVTVQDRQRRVAGTVLIGRAACGCHVLLGGRPRS